MDQPPDRSNGVHRARSLRQRIIRIELDEGLHVFFNRRDAIKKCLCIFLR